MYPHVYSLTDKNISQPILVVHQCLVSWILSTCGSVDGFLVPEPLRNFLLFINRPFTLYLDNKTTGQEIGVATGISWQA